jgi:hypothetical protein
MIKQENTIQMRRFDETGWPFVWLLLHKTFLAGDTYAFSPDSIEADIHKA